MSRYSLFDASTYNPSGGRGPDGISRRYSDVQEAPMQIKIEGGVTQVGGEDYIRKDQLPSIVEQASKMGEARTMRRLQMNPGARRKVGL